MCSADTNGCRLVQCRKVEAIATEMQNMLTDITHVTVFVEDTDDALSWYTGAMGFEERADEALDNGGRWVTVAPPDGDTEIVLQEPDPAVHGSDRAAEMHERIGEATMTVLGTDDCETTVAQMEDRGVTIVTGPEPVPWGIHAVITDLYGNPYNLVEERS